MPSRRSKATPTNATRSESASDASPDSGSFFPFARYTSIVGVHTSLLAFSALILPTTSLSLLSKGASLFSGSDAAGEDRPKRDIVQLLTEDPVRTVAWVCAGALILQTWWASWVKAWTVELRDQASSRTAACSTSRRKYEPINPPQAQNLPQAFAKAAAVTFTVSVLLHAVTVFHPLHTYSMSLLLAVLAVFPPAYILDVPSLASDSSSLVTRLTWIRLFAELSPRTPIERALVYPAVGAAIGCWAGAIPIGLDWERPWQAWPLTPAFGAVGGYIAGSLIALAVSAILAFAQVHRDHQAQQQAKLQAPKSQKSKRS
ncbi:PIG-F-domain-containing protein [Trametes sanguinea]|nr:PIG-F-domain-containing protein [Trametes sanguinea]